MVVFIAGCVVALLGVASAVMLMAGDLGLAMQPPGPTLWIFFPVFTLIGWGLVVIASRDPVVRLPTRLIAWPLLLALVAAVALMGSGAGLLKLGSQAALWYVMMLGGCLGLLGSIGGNRSPQQG